MAEMSLEQQKAIALASARLRAQQGASAPPAPDQYVGSVLPIRKDADGAIHFDSDAGLVGMAKRAIMAPGDAMNGNLQVLDAAGNVTQEAIDRGGEFASTFSPVNPAIRSGEAIIPGVRAGAFKTEKVPTPSTEELKAASKAGFDNLRSADARYSSDHVGAMATQVQQALEDDGFNATTAPKTFSSLQGLQNPPEGSFANSGNLETARRTFNQIGQDFQNPSDRTAAKRVRGSLDAFVDAPPDGAVLPGSEEAAAVAGTTAANARGDWAASKRAGYLNGVVENAEDQAGATGSGDNFGNLLRQRAVRILGSPKLSSGFTDNELGALRVVARGTTGENILRRVSNILGGGGGMAAAVSTGVAGSGASALTGSPWAAAAGIAAPVVGSLARKAANSMTARDFAAIEEATRQRSPLYLHQLANAKQVPVTPTIAPSFLRSLMMGGTDEQGQ